MKRTTLFAMIATGAVLVSGLVLGGCHGNPPKTHAERAQKMVDHLGDELKLDADQKVKLNKIKDECLAKHKELGLNPKVIADEALAQARTDKVDAEKMNKVIDEQAVKMQEMRKFMVVKMAEFWTILKPEQKAKVAKKMEKIHAHVARFMPDETAPAK